MSDKQIKSVRQQIIEALDLHPWGPWESYKLEENAKRNSELDASHREANAIRQTGRTTRIMVSALVAMSRGFKVTILAQRFHGYQKVLLDRLRDMARELGLDPKLVVKERADIEFCDHTYYE